MPQVMRHPSSALLSIQALQRVIGAGLLGELVPQLPGVSGAKRS
jgi:hypothetical protein